MSKVGFWKWLWLSALRLPRNLRLVFAGLIHDIRNIDSEGEFILGGTITLFTFLGLIVPIFVEGWHPWLFLLPVFFFFVFLHGYYRMKVKADC